jgi:hypothetical protein
VLASALSFVGTVRADSPPPPPPLPPPSPELTTRLLSLVADAGQFKLLDASPQGYQLGLVNESGRTVGVMGLATAGSDSSVRFHTKSFAVQIGNFTPDEKVTEQLVKAAHLVADRDDGAWAHTFPDTGPQLAWWEDPANLPDTRLVYFTAAIMLAAMLVGVWRRGRVSWEIRLPHLIPACIQVILFTYWGLYFGQVKEHAPSILLQLMLGFSIDALFAFLKFGSWRIGASPLPIVLSSNLFAWFTPLGIVINLGVAFASKTFLHRNGRHVLNPSATGLATAGLTAMLFPQWVSFGGVFHVMNLAPNMTELVVLLALWPQSRFRIVPVSIAALVVLQLLQIPGAVRPSMLLAIGLLATDPATIPKTDLGKLLFGVFIGLAFPLTSITLRTLGTPDDFSKVLAIPFANALVPTFDRAGLALWSLGARVLGYWKTMPARLRQFAVWRIPDLGMIAIWLFLAVPAYLVEKPRLFEPALVWTLGTPNVIRDADDVPRSAHNPLFCKGFSFVEEARLWRQRLNAGQEVPSAHAPMPIVQGPPQ